MSEPVAKLPSLEGVLTPHAVKRASSKDGKQSSKRSKAERASKDGEQLVPPEIVKYVPRHTKCKLCVRWADDGDKAKPEEFCYWGKPGRKVEEAGICKLVENGAYCGYCSRVWLGLIRGTPVTAWLNMPTCLAPRSRS